LRHNSAVETRFILGPAGSGKTWRCLDEIRAELRRAPEGLPLLLLAPKQATFQLERQLLGDAALAGYTRLEILSFDRLAGFVTEQLLPYPPQLLDDEGRVMVLRALLGRLKDRLRLFHSTARLPGFARQLSLLLREFQRHHLAPARLRQLADSAGDAGPLPAKLRDLATILEAYLSWLAARGLHDADSLPDLATEALRAEARKSQPIRLAGLWLDGFAEMTEQELQLLAALVPFCERATLAFCLEAIPSDDPSWLSTWSVVAQTFRRCHGRLAARPDRQPAIELLPRSSEHGRFAGNSVLQHLETHWTQPQPFAGWGETPSSQFNQEATRLDGVSPHHRPPDQILRFVKCPDAHAEAVFAAREILRHVRAGGRYRDCAVLLRQLDGHHDALRRVFTRYGIPFFLDRREPVAHHPLAELTRFALRTVAFGWRVEDWFGALKSGLVPARDELIDELENAALENGWTGDVWRQPLPARASGTDLNLAEQLRQRLVPPFERLAHATAHAVSGGALAAALRRLWADLEVERQLEEWGATAAAPGGGPLPGNVYQTVWRQMGGLLENLERAFPGDAEPLPLREWLPILEAGLGGLTVGVIPPSLDQVLIGAVDRSRSPELELVILAGLHEGGFPAPPAPGVLLTDNERAELERRQVTLGPSPRQRIGHERYLGYIASTRARGRLVLTRPERDAEGKALNPSPFIAHLQRLFPGLAEESFNAPAPWTDSLHWSELAAPLAALMRRLPAADPAAVEVARLTSHSAFGIRHSAFPNGVSLPRLLQKLSGPTADDSARLSPVIAAQLYGPAELRTSVSRLEQFAACPFRFFVNSGLAADERRQFEVDARERGSFQHDILARFHEELAAEGKRWRDLAPGEASQRLARIAEAAGAAYRGGLFQASDHTLFTARSLTRALQTCVETLIEWMRAAYQFDPLAVEFGFGGDGDAADAWPLDLGDGHRLLFRGKVDRVDLARAPASDEAWCVILDYKSSARRIEPVLLESGVQIQLPAYLAALRALAADGKLFDGARLRPAGLFYVNLRGTYPRGGNRDEVLQDAREVRRAAFQHTGRLNLEALPLLDSLHATGGSGQFKYRVNKDGNPRKGGELLHPADFNALLDAVEQQLVSMGRRIFAGEAAVDPYRKGSATACDRCDYRAVCRIDPQTHRFRALTTSTEDEK
jgi:ATP-dependent helicase/nuclease subunit B